MFVKTIAKICVTLFFIALNSSLSYSGTAGDCKITSGTWGGDVLKIYREILSEYKAEKKAGCREVAAVSGASAYAMVLSFPVCVTSSTRIGIHGVFNMKTWKRMPDNAKWSKWYFSKVTPSAKAYFYKNGGNKTGIWGMVYVPANNLGKPFCKGDLRPKKV